MTIPNNFCFGCVQHGKLIQSFLRTDFLKDTDKQVGNDYRQEGQTAKRACRNNQNREYGKNQVEVSEQIAFYDLPHGFRLFRNHFVRPATIDPFLHLFLR